ncbi:hypothetical protein M3Y99_01915400 [Aphelenchoides fujianensis]|nr:hypothetical protein M3Y99_01915400 [Aphelenchoides fujianensis]
MEAQIPEPPSIFAKDGEEEDVFIRLSFKNEQRLQFDEILGKYKHVLVDLVREPTVGLYVYRDEASVVVVARFKSEPKFSPIFEAKIRYETLSGEEVRELRTKQLYALDDGGLPDPRALAVRLRDRALIAGYYFQLRTPKHHEKLRILNVFNRGRAMFIFEQHSMNGETFYAADQWSKDVRVSINEDAERAFNVADEVVEMKNFREYKPNDVVLVKNGGYVRRACVLWCADNNAEVLCVDYGTKLMCSVGQMRVAAAAIPCVLNGIHVHAPFKTRHFIDELLHSLDRSVAKLEARGQDEEFRQQVEITFVQKHNNEVTSVAAFPRGRTAASSGSPPSRRRLAVHRYSRTAAIVHAHEIKLSDEVEAITRPFANPVDHLVANDCTRMLGIAI